jgi:nitroreductase
MKLDAIECMQKRKSAREFSDKKIPEEVLQRILEGARFAPSSKNTQPWKLSLIEGARLCALRKELCEQFDLGAQSRPDFSQNLQELYRPRAIALGKSILTYKGITREDKEGRRQHDRANFDFFNAKQILVLSVAKEPNETTLMDLGIFAGYLMLAIENEGLACCPQVSVINYADSFRKILPELQEEKIAMVFPVGYPLENSHVNNFRSERENINVWFQKIS